MAIRQVFTTVEEIQGTTGRKAGLNGGIFKFGGFLYMAVPGREDVFEIACLNGDCSAYNFYGTPKLVHVDSDIRVELVDILS